MAVIACCRRCHSNRAAEGKLGRGWRADDAADTAVPLCLDSVWLCSFLLLSRLFVPGWAVVAIALQLVQATEARRAEKPHEQQEPRSQEAT